MYFSNPKSGANWEQTMGSRGGTVVRALASHQCGPGSILSTDHLWAKYVVGSFSAPRGFPSGTPVFPSLQKLALLNSNSTRNAQMHNTWAPGSGDWMTTPRVIELKQLDFWFWCSVQHREVSEVQSCSQFLSLGSWARAMEEVLGMRFSGVSTLLVVLPKGWNNKSPY